MSRSFVIRADASHVIGAGHVKRCLTLAAALRERRVAVSFVCREHVGHLCDVVEDCGFAVRRLPARGQSHEYDARLETSAWAGGTWEQDADDTARALGDLSPDWLIVDHYALDSQWERVMRRHAKRIMVIDDLADRQHDCDLLLDQNLISDAGRRYKGSVPEACTMLLGPRFAMLDAAYAHARLTVRPREGPIRRILITFGGVDRTNIVGRAVEAFVRADRADVHADVVLSANHPHETSIRAVAETHPNIDVHRPLPALTPLMAAADLAIGATGTTSWERLCLGLPTVAVTMAPNQRPVAEALESAGLIRWLGDDEACDTERLEGVLKELLRGGLPSDWSRRCLAVVDGAGVLRVRAALTIDSATPLALRQADTRDEAILLRWANDPVVRASAFSADVITPAAHAMWFGEKLARVDCCKIYIAETDDGVPVGQVRFDLRGGTWEVDYSVAAEYRGRGIGRRVVVEAIHALARETPGGEVRARVRADNIPSRKVFTALGFDADAQEDGVVVYRRAF